MTCSMFEIMNARDNEAFKVSYLFTQKEVKRDIYTILRIQILPTINNRSSHRWHSIKKAVL